jgi:rhodanese-related sulfurtransferase
MSGPEAIPAIDALGANALRQNGAPPRPVLVDVREANEFIAVRVEGAAFVPLSTFLEGHTTLPKDRPLLVMCAAGVRSAAAASFLLRNGWHDVTNVSGGIDAWQRAGLPVRRGPLEPGEGEIPGSAEAVRRNRPITRPMRARLFALLLNARPMRMSRMKFTVPAPAAFR